MFVFAFGDSVSRLGTEALNNTTRTADTEPCPEVLPQGPEARAGRRAAADVPEAPPRHAAAAELGGR
jgi:hypothetical protein